MEPSNRDTWNSYTQQHVKMNIHLSSIMFSVRIRFIWCIPFSIYTATEHTNTHTHTVAPKQTITHVIVAAAVTFVSNVCVSFIIALLIRLHLTVVPYDKQFLWIIMCELQYSFYSITHIWCVRGRRTSNHPWMIFADVWVTNEWVEYGDAQGKQLELIVRQIHRCKCVCVRVCVWI